jgi:uncharacterized protein
MSIDRLSIRTRPSGSPIMHQTWGKLLFLHWRVPEERLRPLIPERLIIDTWEGTAWVGVTPFTMWNVRPTFLPPMPFISETHELNVRTYVHLDGVPGVWFFSLDAANPLAVYGARLGFHLPYYRAEMELREEGRTIRYRSRRTHRDAPPAEFEASWTTGEPLPDAAPETRDFFLVERYCLYAENRGKLYRGRIFHRPWPLAEATLIQLSSTMLEAQGITTPTEPPVLHQQRDSLHVEVWPLEEV